MKLYSDDKTQSIDFVIPEKYKKICVNCSGGADSAILLYMVIDYVMKNNMTDTTVSVTSCSNAFKHRWNGRKAANVINWILHKTGFENFDMHYTYYRDKQYTPYFHDVEGSLFADKRIDIIISGITSNPLSECVVTDIDGKEVDLLETGLTDRTVEADVQTFFDEGDRAFYTPFKPVDKKFISSMFRQYDVMDLFDITRSCETIPTTEHYDPNFENKPCGRCWWCLERKWAFGRY